MVDKWATSEVWSGLPLATDTFLTSVLSGLRVHADPFTIGGVAIMNIVTCFVRLLV